MPVKDFATHTTNMTNINTVTWSDIGKIWLLELNPSFLTFSKNTPPVLSFGVEALITQEVMQLESVQELRRIAIQDIEGGTDIDTIPECNGYNHCWRWQYRISDYLLSLYHAAQGDLARVYLGSYSSYVNIYPNPEGTYTLEYLVDNDSSLDSFTRFRRNFTGFWPRNATRGDGIEIGGTIRMQFRWTEIYNPATGEVQP